MSRLEKVALAGLILIAVVLWAVLGWDFYREKWQAPLGPSLALPSQTPGATPSPVFLTPLKPTSSPQPNAPSRASAQVEPLPLCGGPKLLNILAIGSDTRATGYLYGLADVTRLVRIDFITPRVTVLEFPRDIWVEIPGISDHYGTTHGKINQAYLYGNPGMGYYDGPGQGPGLELLHLPGDRREGAQQVPALVIETRFPLGLFRVWTVWRPATRVLVYPRPEAPAPALPAPQSGDMGQGAARLGSAGEFDGVRAYRRGDPLKHIVWKKMARTDEPISREFQQARLEPLWLELPPHIGR